MIDYSDFSVENAVAIVQACLAANKPQMIVPALLDRRSAQSVAAELALAAATTRSPERTAARAPAAAESTNALRDAIEKRFRAQNGRRAS
jgi:hypothetical protein